MRGGGGDCGNSMNGADSKVQAALSELCKEMAKKDQKQEQHQREMATSMTQLQAKVSQVDRQLQARCHATANEYDATGGFGRHQKC